MLMVASSMEPNIPLDAVRDQIADTVAGYVKAYNVPAACVRTGIQAKVEDGEVDEAFRSKRGYVKRRILELERAALLRIAEKVVTEFGAPDLAKNLSEMRTPAAQPVSPLVRRDLLRR